MQQEQGGEVKWIVCRRNKFWAGEGKEKRWGQLGCKFALRLKPSVELRAIKVKPGCQGTPRHAVFSGLADSMPIFLKLLLSKNSFRKSRRLVGLKYVML